MTWKTQPLSDLCELNIGRTPSRNRREYWGAGTPWLSIADMNQGRSLAHTKEQITDIAVRDVMGEPVTPNTVALSFKLSIGKVGITAVPMYTNEAIATLPILKRDELLPEFLYWALRSIDLTRDTDSAVMGKTLNKKKLARLMIPVPPLDDQRHIVRVLDQADSLRNKRQEAIALLDDLTRSIFLDMFGDPVRNERGWPDVVVNDFVESFESGKSFHAAADESDSTFRILKISAVTSGIFNPAESKAVPADYQPPASHFVRAGDLLFSRANTSELIGATALVEEAPDQIVLPDKLWRFVWHSPRRANPHYVWHLFRQPHFRAKVSNRASGSSGSMKNVSQTNVLSIKCGLPPLELQDQFAVRLQKLASLRTHYLAHLAELDALFASLQDRAFKGELWNDALT